MAKAKVKYLEGVQAKLRGPSISGLNEHQADVTDDLERARQNLPPDQYEARKAVMTGDTRGEIIAVLGALQDAAGAWFAGKSVEPEGRANEFKLEQALEKVEGMVKPQLTREIDIRKVQEDIKVEPGTNISAHTEPRRSNVGDTTSGNVQRQANADGGKAAEGASENPSQFKNLELGDKLGSGGEKDVYALKGQNDIAAGLSKTGDRAGLQDEANMLAQLKREGLPTVDVKGITDIMGKPAMIMDRYAEGSKDIVKTINGNVTRVGDSSALNEQSIADLQSIKETLTNKQIRISDLQFLIGKDGHVVIADPVEIKLKTKPSSVNNQTIDKLIEAAQDNVSRRK